MEYTSKCIVPCCGYRRPKECRTTRQRSMFGFPQNENELKKWVKEIEGVQVRDVKPQSKVCEVHFDTKFVSMKQAKNSTRTMSCLASDAIPTLHLRSKDNPSTVSNFAATQNRKTAPKSAGAKITIGKVIEKNSTLTPKFITQYRYKCIVPCCGYKQPLLEASDSLPRLTLFRIPTEKVKDWVNRIEGLTVDDVTSTSRICEAHFDVKFIPNKNKPDTARVYLSYDAFPTLNLKKGHSKTFLKTLNSPKIVSDLTITESTISRKTNSSAPIKSPGLSIANEENSSSNTLVKKFNISIEIPNLSVDENVIQTTRGVQKSADPSPVEFLSVNNIEVTSTSETQEVLANSRSSRSASQSTPGKIKNHSTSKPVWKNFGSRCIVPSCGYHQPLIHTVDPNSRRTLFRFPKEKTKNWVGRIDGISVKNIKITSKICDAHFEPKFIQSKETKNPGCLRITLSPEAYPSLNLGNENNSPVLENATTQSKDTTQELDELSLQEFPSIYVENESSTSKFFDEKLNLSEVVPDSSVTDIMQIKQSNQELNYELAGSVISLKSIKEESSNAEALHKIFDLPKITSVFSISEADFYQPEKAIQKSEDFSLALDEKLNKWSSSTQFFTGKISSLTAFDQNLNLLEVVENFITTEKLMSQNAQSIDDSLEEFPSLYLEDEKSSNSMNFSEKLDVPVEVSNTVAENNLQSTQELSNFSSRAASKRRKVNKRRSKSKPKSKLINRFRSTCIISSCGYRQPSIHALNDSTRRTLFRFPKGKVEDWVNRIKGLKVENVKENTRICEIHFEPKFIQLKSVTGLPRTILTADAFPSLKLKHEENSASKIIDEKCHPLEKFTIQDKSDLTSETYSSLNKTQEENATLNTNGGKLDSLRVAADLMVAENGVFQTSSQESPDASTDENFTLKNSEEIDFSTFSENIVTQSSRLKQEFSSEEFSSTKNDEETTALTSSDSQITPTTPETSSSMDTGRKLNAPEVSSHSTFAETNSTKPMQVKQELKDLSQEENSWCNYEAEALSETVVLIETSDSDVDVESISPTPVRIWSNQKNTASKHLFVSSKTVNPTQKHNGPPQQVFSNLLKEKMDLSEAVTDQSATQTTQESVSPPKKISSVNMRKPYSKNHKLAKKFAFSCIVPCCGYRRPAIQVKGAPVRRSLFQFTKERAEQWVSLVEGIKLKDLKPTSKICEAHFEPRFITTRDTKKTGYRMISLTPDAVPTLNLRSQENPPNQRLNSPRSGKRVLMDITQKPKLSPPAPLLKKFRIQTGIKLLWDMTLTAEHEKVRSFELFASKDERPSVASLKKIGEVRAVSLPMSCDLNSQELTEEKNYCFVVRAVDVRSRLGRFSNVCRLT